MNEFRRLINRKVVIGFIALLIINVSLYVYQQTKGAGIKELRFETAQRQWCVDYYGNYDIEVAINAVDSDIKRILSYRKADKQGTVAESEVQAGAETEVLGKYKALSESEQLLFLTVLRDIESQLEYIKKYPEDMKQIQTNAQQLMTFSIFSDKNSFTYNNIVKTGKDFEKVADVSLYLVNNKAAGSFVNYYYTFYFALIMMVFIIYGLSGERDNGMWGIVHSAGSGRLRLALHRLFIIAGSGVVITAGLYFTTFAAALLLYGGAGALNAPVQSIQAFERFAMPMSQIGFVLYNYVYSALAVVVLSVALWTVFVVNRKRNHALILTGVVVGLEVLMYYRIGLHSIYSAFKQINIVLLCFRFLIRLFFSSRTVRMTLTPIEVETGETVHYADSTRNARSWLWEFGNGDISHERSGEYVFKKPGRYQVRLQVDGGLERKQIITVHRSRDDYGSDELVRMKAPATAFQGEIVSFKGYGPSKEWRWQFGESGIVDSREQNPLYAYTEPGIYEVLLTTENTQYPVRHTIEILPQYTENDSTDVLVIIGNDIREHLQAIVDGKPFNTHYNYILKKYLCGNPDIAVTVNNSKKNDFYSYCQGLKIIARRKTLIDEVFVDMGDNLNNECVMQLMVTQHERFSEQKNK